MHEVAMIGMCTELYVHSKGRSSSFLEGAVPTPMTSGSSQGKKGEENFRQGRELEPAHDSEEHGTDEAPCIFQCWREAPATALESTGTSP